MNWRTAESSIYVAVTSLIGLPRRNGDKKRELWMLCENTNHEHRKLKAKGFQEDKAFEGIAFKE